MKKLALLALIALCGLSACKTSESNYRAAYETARQKQADDGGVDPEIAAAMRHEEVPEVVLAEGDSIRMKSEFIKITAAPDTMPVFVYGIVVGQFRQVFNAKAMRNRLIGQGYTGALIAETGDPVYYVVAVQAETVEKAAAEMRKIKADRRLVLREPLPWVLKAVGGR